MFHTKKILKRRMICLSFLASLAFVALFSFAQTDRALAASNPPLGLTATFGILASTYTNTAGGTTISGDLGYTIPPAVAATITGTIYTPVLNPPIYATAGLNQATALATLDGNSCDFTFAAGAIDLASDITHIPAFGSVVGEYTPGVYCILGAADIGGGGTITLNGSGTYIFRMTGALNTSSGSIVTFGSGASNCDVFWTPGGATTLGANSTFEGTVIDAAGITIGNAATWGGRALAFGGTVSTAGDAIAVPTSCAGLDLPTITKVFFPTTIAVNGTSTITFTLANTDSTPAANAGFTDTLTNMSISGAQSAGGTCAGAGTNNFTDGQTNLSFTGLTIPASGSCTVTVVVTSGTIGTHPNSTSGVSSDTFETGPVSNIANLIVVAADTAAPTISKSFFPSNIPLNGTSTITFTLANTNGSDVTGANFTDALVNMSISGAQNAGGTCAGAGTNSFIDGQTGLIIFTGLTIPASGSCTVTVVVTSDMAGTNSNSTSGVASDNTPTGAISNTVNLTVSPIAIPTLNEWGMIIFMVLAGLGAVYYLRKYRRV